MRLVTSGFDTAADGIQPAGGFGFSRTNRLRLSILLPAIGALLVCSSGHAAQSSDVVPSIAAVQSPVATVPLEEPTAESCEAAVGSARSLAESLPAGDLSRRAAESYLVQAKVEAGNGEFDDCIEFAGRASVEVREHRHVLKPGEALEAHPAR